MVRNQGATRLFDNVRQGDRNANKVEIGDVSLYFSYRTLVGLDTPAGRWKTSKYHSRTTSKHINEWFLDGTEELEQEELEEKAYQSLGKVTPSPVA